MNLERALNSHFHEAMLLQMDCHKCLIWLMDSRVLKINYCYLTDWWFTALWLGRTRTLGAVVRILLQKQSFPIFRISLK